jgi:hypothetical protein
MIVALLEVNERTLPMMVAGALWKPAARAFLFLGTEKWSPRGSFLLLVLSRLLSENLINLSI